MKFGLSTVTRGVFSSRANYMAVAKAAERAGFDFLSVSDHLIVPAKLRTHYPYTPSGAFAAAEHGHCFDQLATIAFLAGCTERLRLLTSVLVVPHRPAMLTAKMLATIDVLANGRLIVGVGAGWMKEEFALLGAPFEDRGKVTDEYLDAFRELWTKDAPSYRGKHVSFADVLFYPKPLQKPHPPIWVGGESAAALRRAARLGDAWYPGNNSQTKPLDTPARLGAGIAEVRRMAQAAGRDPASLGVALLVQDFFEWEPHKIQDGIGAAPVHGCVGRHGRRCRRTRGAGRGPRRPAARRGVAAEVARAHRPLRPRGDREAELVCHRGLCLEVASSLRAAHPPGERGGGTTRRPRDHPAPNPSASRGGGSGRRGSVGAGESLMGTGVGLREVGYFDCAGGGQVVVVDGIAYIGHMRSPHGTSVVDVRDPKNCKELAKIAMPPGTHSHKVRVANGLMVVNHEVNNADTSPIPADFRGGIGIYDVSTPAKPREITRWNTQGKGVHRFDFDGRHVYMSPTLEGYVGTIVMIMDLKDPARPQETGRWWMPGQWTAGGETADLAPDRAPLPSPAAAGQPALHQLLAGRLRHPRHRRHGQAEAGLRPRLVAAVRLPDAHGAAAALRHQWPPLHDRRRRGRAARRQRGAGLHVDRRHHRRAPSGAGRQLPGGGHRGLTAAHHDELPPALREGDRHGDPVRLVRQRAAHHRREEPAHPREVAHFMPDVPQGTDRVSSNDVTVDDRGLIYLIDRRRGLTIVERI